MWMLVMFDLPTKEKPERKVAAKFRKYLLDEGFFMAQFSIYYKALAGRDAAKALTERISRKVPHHGSVHILMITDKQYENLQTFEGLRGQLPKKLEQLQLF